MLVPQEIDVHYDYTSTPSPLWV